MNAPSELSTDRPNSAPPATCGERPDRNVCATLSWREVLLWVILAAAAFHAAYAWPPASSLVVVYLLALVQLARADTWRKAFYSGLAVGLLIAAVRLAFFYRIFGAGAAVLWLVYAFWLGLFVALARLWLNYGRTTGSAAKQLAAWSLIPFLWCGLEYFRSELYYLRFSWLSPGFAFSPADIPAGLGVYGIGFLLMSLACVAAVLWRKSRLQAAVALLAGLGALRLWGVADRAGTEPPPTASVHVGGVQMEFPSEPEVLLRLNELVRRHPETELIVLSEYTFSEPIPEKIKAWCRAHHRYLIVGGTEPLTGGNYYNTAFVISPAGEVVFRQAKRVPIQFFRDGLPAAAQNVWESPWGRIGICICYDLSYRCVTDRLIELGAQALVVPTMDVADWGEDQHRLHARVAPLRAAEYRLPIFRLASSGISQTVDGTGRVLATAPWPGDGANLVGRLEMRGRGRLPLDHWLAPLATGVSGCVLVFLLLWQVAAGALGRTPPRTADKHQP